MPKDWPRREDSLEDDGAGDNYNDDDDTSSSDDETGFFVKIETLMGSSFHVFAYSSDTIELLKTRIAFQEGIPQKDQNLFISRRPLDNPNTALADIGLNEETASSINLRIITNISSGLPKGILSRESTPPAFPFPTAIPFPLIPTASFRRDQGTSTANNSNAHHDSDDRLPQLTEDEIDGVLVVRDKNDRRIFLILKRPNGLLSLENDFDFDNSSLPLISTRGRNRRRESREANNYNRTARNLEFSGRREDLRANEGQEQLDRIRENATTLQKMNDIRKTLVSKRKGHSVTNNDTELTRKLSETQLPDINLTRNLIRPPKSPPAEPKPRHQENSRRRERILSTSQFGQSSLNRLMAEIYLESRKTGGGCYGLLPYTNVQLCRYVQLKVKVLLDQQQAAPDKFDVDSCQFVKANQSNKCLIPTVVQKRREEVPKFFENSRSGRRRTNLSTARLDSARENIATSLFRECNVISSGSDAALKSLLGSAKSGRKQRAVIISPKNSSSNSNLFRNGSGGKRPLSGTIVVSIPGTSATIQKKKKEGVVRCQECRKRIGVACRYQCRCGKVFCSVHRYAEVHKCTYDYKEEGRRQIEAANPLIVANKVDKI